MSVASAHHTVFMEQKTKKILIVDDEPDILEFLEYNLKKEGFIVVTATDGVMAMKVAHAELPDIILLDIMMPEQDGVETCTQLRADPKFKAVPIAFLTARDEDYTQIAALEIGGDDYITKPIKPKVLMSRIKALLRRSTLSDNQNENEISVNDLIIDRSRFVVRRGAETLEFPKKEFEIIWLLSTKPSQVFSREEIYEKIWGDDIIVGQRTIDVHIRKIREKLGDTYIKTLKGVGYKLE
jgi:two-component system, OmpR family, alkaline phosphatase synthesis response regulator PhoP